MALIYCPECEKQVSDKATACPNCGYPIANTANYADVTNTIQNTESDDDLLIENIVQKYGNNRIAAVRDVSHILGLSLTEAKKKVDDYHKNNKVKLPASRFKITRTVHTLFIDEKNRLWRNGVFGAIMKFEDIIDLDIYENGSSLTKTSTASMLGRAAVGAVVLNPLAAVVGGVTATKKSVEVVDSLQVVITTRNISNPLVKIDLKIPKKTKKDSKDYTKYYGKAQMIESTLKSLAYN